MIDGGFTPSALRNAGFAGFRSIEEIRRDPSIVSALPGVYVVYRDRLDEPQFLHKSTGGWFKGRDPSVSIEKLKENWVGESHVLYVGKADAGSRGTRGIRTRFGEYLRFGQGQPIGHWGGRYLWHLAGADQLLVCWKPCSDPSEEETRLLDLFRTEYGALPFANLKGGTRR